MEDLPKEPSTPPSTLRSLFSALAGFIGVVALAVMIQNAGLFTMDGQTAAVVTVEATNPSYELELTAADDRVLSGDSTMLSWSAEDIDSPPITSLSFVGSAVSNTSSITIPAAAQAGDLAIFYDYGHNSSVAVPSYSLPSGWTFNTAGGVSARGLVSYKVLTSGDLGQSITGISGNNNNKVIHVFRPNAPIVSVTSPHPWSLTATTNNPSAQTVSASGASAPVIIFGAAAHEAATAAFSTASPAFTATVLTADSDLITGYRIYNSGPANHSVDMNDLGGDNFLASGYLVVAGGSGGSGGSVGGWLSDTGVAWNKTSAGINVSSWSDAGDLASMAYALPAIVGNTAYIVAGTVSGIVQTGFWYTSLSNPQSGWTVNGQVFPNSYYSGFSRGGVTDAQHAIIGGYMYLFGGSPGETYNNGSSCCYRNTLYTGDRIWRAPTSNLTSVWSDNNQRLPGELSTSQLAIIGNYVYLFGGHDGTSPTNTIYRAPTSDPRTWTNTGATLPTPLYGSQLAVIGDYVYLFGGATNSNTTNAIFRAPISDPTDWSIVAGKVLPSPLWTSKLLLAGDYVYLFGGWNGTRYIDDIYRARVTDPTTWEDSGSNLPARLAYGEMAIFGAHAYYYGGFAFTDTSSSYNTNVYRAPLTAASASCTVFKTDSSGTSVFQTANSGTNVTTGPLTEETSYRLTCNMSDGTIQSTDLLTVGIGASLPTVTVSSSGSASESGSTGTFTVTRSTTAATPLDIAYAMSGSATAGTDYRAIVGPLTIPANQLSVATTVTPLNDTNYSEGSETVTFTISSNAGYTLGSPSSANVSIADVATAPAPEVSSCEGAAGGSCELGVSPSRVRSGTATTVTWNVTGLAPNNTCRIERSPDDSSFPVNSTASAPTWNGSANSTITQQTIFKLTCTGTGANTSTTRTINVIPFVKEY